MLGFSSQMRAFVKTATKIVQVNHGQLLVLFIWRYSSPFYCGFYQVVTEDQFAGHQGSDLFDMEKTKPKLVFTDNK